MLLVCINRIQYRVKVINTANTSLFWLYYLPESYSEWEDIDEGIDLKHTQKEHSEVLKGLREEVPEEAKIRSLVRDT